MTEARWAAAHILSRHPTDCHRARACGLSVWQFLHKGNSVCICVRMHYGCDGKGLHKKRDTACGTANNGNHWHALLAWVTQKTGLIKGNWDATKSVHLDKINMRRKGQSVKQSLSRLVVTPAGTGSTPLFTPNMPSTPSNHLLRLRVLRQSDPLHQPTGSMKPSGLPGQQQHFYVSLPSSLHCHRLLHSTCYAEVVLCRRGEDRRSTAKDSNVKETKREITFKKTDYKINEQIN